MLCFPYFFWFCSLGFFLVGFLGDFSVFVASLGVCTVQNGYFFLDHDDEDDHKGIGIVLFQLSIIRCMQEH